MPNNTHATRKKPSSPSSTNKGRGSDGRFRASDNPAPANPHSVTGGLVPAPRRGRPALTPQERAKRPFTPTIIEYVEWLNREIFAGKLSRPQKEAAGIAITLYGHYQASPERRAARGLLFPTELVGKLIGVELQSTSTTQ